MAAAYRFVVQVSDTTMLNEEQLPVSKKTRQSISSHSKDKANNNLAAASFVKKAGENGHC